MNFQLPCQIGCKNDQIVLQQQQKPNKSHSDPIYLEHKLPSISGTHLYDKIRWTCIKKLLPDLHKRSDPVFDTKMAMAKNQNLMFVQLKETLIIDI